MIRTALAVCASVSVSSFALAQNRPTDPLPLPAVPAEAIPPASDNPFRAAGNTIPSAAPAPAPAPATPAAEPTKTAGGFELLRQATAVFNQAKTADPSQFLNARDLFGLAFREKVQMSPDQTAAWAYCRIKVAADRLNKSTDAATAADVLAEVEGALGTVPDRLNLHEAANPILALARKRAGASGRPAVRTPAAVQASEPGWGQIESASFRVKYRTSQATAEEVVRVAEAARAEIFARWSGPPGADWSPKCEIVLHPTGDEFAAATKLPAAATGRAEVKLNEGVPSARRIDLRADDATLATVALPRELTHVVLADLYPNQPPPKWAELGMAVLSTTEAEVNRYLQTVRKCARDGELLPVDQVLAAKEVPAQAVTGFHVESVALVEYLVRAGGEKSFTAFVRDSMRYGTDTALKRQYGLAGARALEDGWKRGTLPTVRGQGE